MRVKKYSGEMAPFDESSLRHSLTRSGASEKEVDMAYAAIKGYLYDGITTKELYEVAFEALANQKSSYAARYSLKSARRELGPEGFYFEKWIARLMQEDGFNAITGQTVHGHAVKHEIDVVAVKGEQMFAIECKFRNDPDSKISVTTPMYFKSRKEDISGINYNFFDKPRQFTEGMMVTNASFTTDSIDFSKHYQIKLLSWDYPNGKSLKALVDDHAEYPVTCLTHLSDREKGFLLKEDCILVKDLLDAPHLLSEIQVSKSNQRSILQEAQELVDRPLKSTDRQTK